MLFDAKVALAALAEATEVIGDEFVASGYTTNSYEGDETKHPLITAPGEKFEYDQLSHLTNEYNTPTADGMNDTAQLLRDEGGKELVLVCITDGCPTNNLGGMYSFGDYEGERETVGEKNGTEAAESAAGLVNRLRDEGIKVFGIGVGGADGEFMDVMFGEENYLMADTDTLAEDLVEVYENQLDVERPHAY
jgi:nitric oxide reductase activation protein